MTDRNYRLDRDETLARRIDAKTYHQILNLDVASEGDSVVVTGRSRTYYVKQLATQAVASTDPQARIFNEIVVAG